METVPELWRPTPQYPNYEASNHGRVRSTDRTETVNRSSKVFTRTRKGRLMRQVRHHSGYMVINLSMCGKAKMVGVHQLVADAFHGPANGLTVNHANGNKDDNTPDNLEYMTNRDNMLHGYKTGLIQNDGEHNGSSKLKVDEVLAIRALRGLSHPRTIANDFGISREHVYDIWNRKVWSHIP